MSDAVWISIISGVVVIANTVMTTLLKINLAKYHKEINGRMGELIDTTKKLGNEQGKAEEKAKHPRK